MAGFARSHGLQGALAAVPLAWSVDLFPILGYLPESFPGLQFKRIARQWRKTIRNVGYVPVRFVLRQMEADIEAARYNPGDGDIQLPVKLKVHDSIFVPYVSSQ